MPQATIAASAANVSSHRASVTAAESLSTLVYHSRAVRPLSETDLDQLVRAAQVRNRGESVTGIMLYDDAHIFQWLEGPLEGVARVMRSIQDDPRHTDIQILNKQPTRLRFFGDWDMKLATSGPSTIVRNHDVLTPARDIIQRLRQQPEAAPQLLTRFAPSAVRGRYAKSILRNVVLEKVIPELAARLVAASRQANSTALPTRPRWKAGECPTFTGQFDLNRPGARLQ